MFDLSTLNEPQREAVLHDKGPLLILAGAGSGKTRVITNRIAYLIEERGVSPYSILAITFTNKAANEMKERVAKLLGDEAYSVWVSTFHASCVRILRRFGEHIGYDRNFSIYDTDDSKSLMKQVLKDLNVDTKVHKERIFLNEISKAKNAYISPSKYMSEAGDYATKQIAKVYVEYQRRLRENNALDFDDLLYKTVELFDNCDEALNYYQNRFAYIMVDEYQDTNAVQFMIIRHLASHYEADTGTYEHNLCVVGDDDQSIYKFRGADITNILSFENAFGGTKVIKLEQNYRSTEKILDIANEVIAHNKGRKSKKLWTAIDGGTDVSFIEYSSDFEEAKGITNDIESRYSTGVGSSYSDFAVLYRTNAQSRLLEERMIFKNIPYRIVGGQNFYQRKEIKDVLAYLKTIDNGADALQIKRIINIPKRGIGDTTLNHIQTYADENGISFYDALHEVDNITTVSRAKDKIKQFTDLIGDFQAKADECAVNELIEYILEVIDYESYIEDFDEDGYEDRLENISSLTDKGKLYEDEAGEEANLSDFLAEVSLVADIDSVESNDDKVLLMTLHSAKGLEFDHVYLAGMEEGLFPNSSAFDNEADLEEERRLCYVGITRARKTLTFTAAKQRMLRGEFTTSPTSRFIVSDIPRHMLSIKGHAHESYLREERRTFGSQSAYKPQNKPNNTYVNPYASAYKTKVIEPPTNGGLDYKEGDTVSHIRFGTGVVTSIIKGSRDYEVTVDFNGTVKKMLASFAKLKKV